MTASRLRRLALLPFAGVVALALSGCSGTSNDAATVTYRRGGDDHTVHITRADFDAQLAGLVANKQFIDQLRTGGSGFSLTADQKNATNTDLAAAYLQLTVNQVPFDAEFERLGLRVSDQARADAQQQVEKQFAGMFDAFGTDTKDAFVMREARAEAVAAYWTSVTDAKLQSLYDAYKEAICPTGRAVSHILVKDEATARSILDRLQSGASFADLAKSESTDTASAKSGGALGCLRKGAFVPEFERAALNAPFGVPTGPVHTQFGWHVIVVRHITFADERSELSQAMQQNPANVVKLLVLQTMKARVDPRYGVAGGLASDPQNPNQPVYAIHPPTAPDVRTVREKPAPTTTTPTVTVPGG